MMMSLQLLSRIFVLLALATCSRAFVCHNTENCNCYRTTQGAFEIQCPPIRSLPSNLSQETGIVVEIQEKEKVKIDCLGDIGNLSKLLPNLEVNKIKELIIRFCPFPDYNFKEILDKFSIPSDGLKTLKFSNLPQNLNRNVTVTKDHFIGLSNVTTLYFNVNECLDFGPDVLQNTPLLEDLEFRNNCISSLSPGMFHVVPNLKTVSLADNYLREIPAGLFDNLPSLTALDLRGNELFEILDSYFHLPNLRFLDLTANQIARIDDHAFSKLPKLRNLGLSRNVVKKLSRGLFGNNGDMYQIYMNSNPGLVIEDHTFSNLTNLRELKLKWCDLSTFSPELVGLVSGVTVLELAGNKLTNLSADLFTKFPNLEQLDLSDNKLTSIPTLTTLVNLTILHLDHNMLEGIHLESFASLGKLEELYLPHNRISKIQKGAFQDNVNLKIADLGHNLFRPVDEADDIESAGLFGQNNKMEKINFAHNLIEYIQDIVPSIFHLVNLKMLDFSYNRIGYVSMLDLQAISENSDVNLSNNNITTVIFGPSITILAQENKNSSLHVNINLANNPLQCDCLNYELVQYIQGKIDPYVRSTYELRGIEDSNCTSPKPLQDYPLKYVPLSHLLCPLRERIGESYKEEWCPETCDCFYRASDKGLLIDCSYRNFTKAPKLYMPSENPSWKIKEIEVRLQGNNLSRGPDRSYEPVTMLDMRYNRLDSLEWVPSKLKILKLDYNRLNTLDYHVLTTLNGSNFTELSIRGNPWRCDCAASNLTSFIRSHKNVLNATDIFCKDHRRLIELNGHSLCHTNLTIYLAVSLCILALLVASMVALYCYYQEEVKVWLFAHNLLLFWVSEEDLDKDKTYDVFISYSHKDEEFVMENLLPDLERGPHPYKVCIHIRNFVPGEFISKQVMDSVTNSRRTLVVLSQHFPESAWGMAEFRAAHTQAMSEGRSRVIIVLFGDVDVNTLDDDLKTYLTTNTYLKWGEKHFWDKLGYALPHYKAQQRKQVLKNSQRHANVMSCIDDKFTLVVPPMNPDSTPPIITLDPNNLLSGSMKGPFDISPTNRTVMTPPAESGQLLTKV